ncbi:heterokaryon incompatibility protein-domain-containing protein [Xylaria palmicola]|nr:heterokaryon incompatibility protein-domain-containing protein [Xylaria palmicola]
MDVRDDTFDTRRTIVNDVVTTVGIAVLVYLADCGTSTQARYVILATDVIYIPIILRRDVRWSIIKTLSLVMVWYCFYSDRDVSLMAIHGAFLITRMTLMTFGNAAIWVAIRGVRFDTDSIVRGNCELGAFLVSWSALRIVGWIAEYCFRPFQTLSAFSKAVIATTVIQIIVVILDRRASSTTQWGKRARYLGGEHQVTDAEIDDNTKLMYARSGGLSSGKVTRLIKLLPQSSGEEMSCEIVSRDLEKQYGDYEAISYTWGDTTEHAVIEIDGRPTRIPRKVVRILRALRHPWRPRMLWIDYICINQNDINEKSHQVAMMRSIYYRAVNVIVWLDPLPDTTVAIDLLLEIARSPGLTGLQGAYQYGQRDQRHRLLALARFIENDYFNRVWVVQEIASAQKIQVLCGGQSILWDDLSFVLKFMENPEMIRCLQSTEEMGVVACDQDSLRHAATMLATRKSISMRVSYSLAFLLCNYRSFKCKDPRDKVFGILGLCRGMDHPLIRPDYNKPEIQVYKDAAKYIFTVERTSRRLFGLAFAGIGNCRRLQELPSWVPDWASNARRKRAEGDGEDWVDTVPTPNHSTFSYHIQPWSNYGNGIEFMRPDQYVFESVDPGLGYQASFDSQVEMKLIEDDVLGIRGFVVDEIQSLTFVFEIPFDERMRISHSIMTLAWLLWFEEAEALVANVPSPYPTGQSTEEVLWRTLIGDRVLETDDAHIIRPAPSDYGLIYRQQKNAAIDMRRACSFMSMETMTEMRDVCYQIFTQLMGGGSIFKVFVEVLCGRSGHPNVWKLMTTGTKFANDEIPRPECPQALADDAQWAQLFEELCEDEEMKSLAAVLLTLFAAFEPQQPGNGLGGAGNNVSRDSIQDNGQDTGQDNSLVTMETGFSQRLAEVSRLGPMVSRFAEGLRISFERRLCVTKKGYIGLVPPLTRVGDVVSILYGGDAPYLVRPETNLAVGTAIGVLRCQLVGECYMHGMMDGEMLGPQNSPLWFHLT